MMQHARISAAASLFLLISLSLNVAGQGAFDGEWRTSFGTVTIKQAGNAVTGTYGDANQFTLKGTVQDTRLNFEYQEGQASGDAQWTLDKSGLSFNGQFKARNGRAGAWQGWRPDPQAIKAKRADFTGLWLTDLGLMQLEQTGGQVKGHYPQGGEIQGTVTGRRFEFTCKAFRGGKGWFDLSADNASFRGAATTEGFSNWYGWQGRRAPEFALHAKLVAGKLIDGSTPNLLTYTARAPESYKPGEKKTYPAIVILHGSNMNGKAYVNTFAAAWPDIAWDYLIIGINGERPSDLDADPKFNYSYIDFVGRSSFKGYPGTDRESPALVAEALDDLRQTYPVSKYFVGGHSQGGFLTYSLLMNYPEKIAGAFPISAGVIFQCEPGAYTDEKLRAAQRAVPLAIVHSKVDPVVNFSSGEYAATLFGQSDWLAFHFFVDEKGAGHRFALLPVREAIRWLEAQSSDDPRGLVTFAEKQLKAGGYRDAIAALNRAQTLHPDAPTKAKLDRLIGAINTQAAAGGKRFLSKIQANQSGDWIDDFLAYRDNFEFAPAAQPAMQAFNALRTQQEPEAIKVMNQARGAFQQGNPKEGYAKYQEITEKYYAASSYRNVKRWLAERK
jgi:predicted esterase